MLIMRPRWSPVINDIRLLIRTIKSLIPELERPKQKTLFKFLMVSHMGLF